MRVVLSTWGSRGDVEPLAGLAVGAPAEEDGGGKIAEVEPGVFLGSSDIGNVSTRVPTIHPFLRILPPDHCDHTPQFALAAGDERGRSAMLAAAEALACTAYDVLSDPALGRRGWSAFQAQESSGG
ncbi:hypothetical protein KN815_24080 [Streptomyces sp. 4503]|uniref:Uncharacterized protein n=1 Tax=Streptomyces niphimycinicus TaxID=2842201 RepID=A0ABS6CJA8_9ACTN|nr:hypothetical protein [Streptomyces niphimycinicus]MBU3867026.1 hypothetical protein [Streptomyces niphimycinicus]